MNLGYYLGSFGDAWGLDVEVDGKVIPLAFDKTQALEIARRITEHYGPDANAVADLREAMREISELTKNGNRLPKHGKSKIANIASRALTRGQQ